MLGFLNTEHAEGVPVEDDPEVQAACDRAGETQHRMEELEADERRFIKALRPDGNEPNASDEVREEAYERLHVRKGTQDRFYLPELDAARASHAQAVAARTDARAQAVERLDAARGKVRKQLVKRALDALDDFIQARDALETFDRQWLLDRETSRGFQAVWITATTRSELEATKKMLKEQGWLS